MIKAAFKVFGKNIWNVFAVIGFVSLGIFIGIFVTFPVIENLTYNSYNHIVSAATNLGQGFSLDAFIKSLNSQIDALDWLNPIRTMRYLFENNGIYTIVVNALKAANLNTQQIEIINDVLITNVDNLVNGLKTEFVIFFSIVVVASLIGYIGTKIVIQIMSTYDHNVLKFIGSFLTNLAILVLIYYLVLITLVSVTGVGLYFSLFAIFVLLLLLTFLSSVLFYRKKGVKFIELFNVKTNLTLLLSGLIMFGISIAVIIGLFFFSDIVALLMSIPLFLTTTIITENIVINFVTGYKNNPKKAVSTLQK